MDAIAGKVPQQARRQLPATAVKTCSKMGHRLFGSAKRSTTIAECAGSIIYPTYVIADYTNDSLSFLPFA